MLVLLLVLLFCVDLLLLIGLVVLTVYKLHYSGNIMLMFC